VIPWSPLAGGWLTGATQGRPHQRRGAVSGCRLATTFRSPRTSASSTPPRNSLCWLRRPVSHSSISPGVVAQHPPSRRRSSVRGRSSISSHSSARPSHALGRRPQRIDEIVPSGVSISRFDEATWQRPCPTRCCVADARPEPRRACRADVSRGVQRAQMRDGEVRIAPDRERGRADSTADALERTTGGLDASARPCRLRLAA